MKKSIFRVVDRYELFACYLFCFCCNTMLDYSKTLRLESFLLQNYLKQLYDYQALIVSLISFIVVIFHYQMVIRKKEELHCRILVGDTIRAAIKRYIVECLIILVTAFIVSLSLNIGLNLSVIGNLYLSALFIFYILISSMVVNRFENI